MAGAVVAAIASTLCCAGPLVAVLIGVSGAGLARTFEPLRPVFVVAALLALGYAHWTVRRLDQQACEPGTLCASHSVQVWIKRTLWTGTGLSVVLLTFPWWSAFVFG